MKEYKGSALRNIPLISESNIHWSMVSGTPRGRFSFSYSKLIISSSSKGLRIINDEINEMEKFSILAFLNSKFIPFFGRLQSKDRKWPAGIIARFPIPVEFLYQNKRKLGELE